MKRWLVFLLVCINISSLAGSTAPGSASPGPRSLARELDPHRQDELGEVELLLYLGEQVDLSGAAGLASKEEKGRYVVEQLRSVALRTQAPLLLELEKLGVDFRPFWVANMVWVRGEGKAVEAIAARPDVARVYANPAVRLDGPEPSGPDFRPAAAAGVEWNIDRVNADEAWAAGITGEGVIIGGQDTGYDWEHPALKNSYRGWDGSSVNHNYNWHDAIHTANASCEADSAFPCDDHGHGTHTMGIMVGGEGEAGNRIGAAPGAKWIGCRNMNEGVGTPASYIECFEWFLAPYAPGESSFEGDPSQAPDIINNSWSCTEEEGCTDPNLLLQVVENVRAAGILVVVSAGNKGSQGCSTIDEPPAIYDASFTVGNSNSSDEIASNSSRGPVSIDGSGRVKPDVTAPGTNIYSSLPGGRYGAFSGTSMAAPHVAGEAALLISADPELRGQVDEIERIIRLSAERLAGPAACGADVPGQAVPNNTYGWGVVDAWRAVLFASFDYFQYLPVISR